jgi:hypothetical protein
MVGDLRNRFRQSKDYAYEMLIRDLIEYAEEIDSRFSALEVAGEWTPVLAFGGASVGITYATQRGGYVKVGSLVVADFEILLTAKGSSVGVATISGLPEAPATDRPAVATVGYWASMSFPAGTQGGILGYGSGPMTVRYHNPVGSSASANETHFNNTSRIIATVSYRAEG